jgi:hypothetical protein
MPTTPLPTRIIELNKAVIAVTAETTRAVADTMSSGAQRAWTTLRTTGATVVGQARSAAVRSADEAAAGAREVVGQASAQGAEASQQLRTIANDTARAATVAVEGKPGRGVPYEDWSKAELYERAQELGIEGRSTMSKPELIAALRT